MANFASTGGEGVRGQKVCVPKIDLQGMGKIGLRPGGGGSRLSPEGGGGVWEMDTCDRTYVWSSLSTLLSLFFYYGMHSLMFKSWQILT